MSETLSDISSLHFSKVFPAPGVGKGSTMDSRKAMEESWRRLREAHARSASNGRRGEERQGAPNPAVEE